MRGVGCRAAASGSVRLRRPHQFGPSSQPFAVLIRHLSCLASCRWFRVASSVDNPVTASIPTFRRGSGASRSDWNAADCLRMLRGPPMPRTALRTFWAASPNTSSRSSPVPRGRTVGSSTCRAVWAACGSRGSRRTRGASTIRAAARRACLPCKSAFTTWPHGGENSLRLLFRGIGHRLAHRNISVNPIQ